VCKYFGETLSAIIQTHNLSFRFKDYLALNNLCLEVPENSIYGFVGPNGAGKSTSIRAILGLYPVENKKIFVFGKEINKERVAILKDIGALVETPALYDHLSAIDNLEITRIVRGAEKKKINQVLEIVGLSKSAYKKVKTYSLGMKQRLGIAIALLSEPKLLILDEPTNGLDPHGIKEIRELLLYLNQECKTTIFLSSHILNEVEKLVTHVGVINKGELAFQGKLAELYSVSINKVLIESDETDKLATMLKESGYVFHKENDFTIKVEVKEKPEISKLLYQITHNDVSIYGLRNEQKSLEELFFDLTKKQREVYEG